MTYMILRLSVCFALGFLVRTAAAQQVVQTGNLRDWTHNNSVIQARLQGMNPKAKTVTITQTRRKPLAIHVRDLSAADRQYVTKRWNVYKREAAKAKTLQAEEKQARQNRKLAEQRRARLREFNRVLDPTKLKVGQIGKLAGQREGTAKLVKDDVYCEVFQVIDQQAMLVKPYSWEVTHSRVSGSGTGAVISNIHDHVPAELVLVKTDTTGLVDGRIWNPTSRFKVSSTNDLPNEDRISHGVRTG